MKINRILSWGIGILPAILLSAVAHAQNVGIGVGTPQSKLSINGTTTSGGMAIGDSTYTSTSGTVAPTNGAIIQGSVGMGIKTPQVPLHVNGQVYVSAGGVTGQFWNGTANMNGVQILPAGYVGAQRSDGSPLHLSKPTVFTNNELIIFSVNSSAVGDVTTTGTGVSYNTTSDERLKENIRPTTKRLNEVMKIQVCDFNFKSKPGQTQTGFIAQQIYTVLPDVVTPGGDDPAVRPWGVDYGRVTPVLTKAIQEQQVEIESLKERIARQNARLKVLASENAKLKVQAHEQGPQSCPYCGAGRLHSKGRLSAKGSASGLLWNFEPASNPYSALLLCGMWTQFRAFTAGTASLASVD